MKPLSVPQRLTKNRFNLDEQESHIEVNQDIAKATGTGKAIGFTPGHLQPSVETGEPQSDRLFQGSRHGRGSQPCIGAGITPSGCAVRGQCRRSTGRVRRSGRRQGDGGATPLAVKLVAVDADSTVHHHP
jgi:hypothetical protein